MHKNLIITGSSGFVGTNFINTAGPYKIKVVDLLLEKVSDIDFKDCEGVLHLAALVHQMKGAPEEQYFRINRDLAVDVAMTAKSQGVKHFVFMSTAKVFGESTTGKQPLDEDSSCNPQDAYGRSKYEAELLIRELEDEYFKVAVVRSPLVYGAGVKANMMNLVRLVDRFPILPFGMIRNKRSYVYIGNLIALLNRIIETKASGIFIAGDKSSISTTELIIFIAKGLDKKVLNVPIPNLLLHVFKFLRPDIIDRLWGSFELDNRLTNERLNFTPPYTSERGIEEMTKWFLSVK